MASWFVYVVRCRDGSLYTGISTDVAARVARHNAGAGARYTRGRGPLKLLVTLRCRDQGLALRVEHAVKRLTRRQKLALADQPLALAELARKLGRRPRTASA